MQIQNEAKPYDDINITPMLDLAYVLLVIFIVTAPLLTHAVKIDLPKASSRANLTRPDHIDLSINAAGAAFWNGAPTTRTELAARLAESARMAPQPEVHIRADRTTQYQNVAEVMSAAARVGLTRIGFVSDPHAP